MNRVRIHMTWRCECDTSTPLRYTKCKSCGKDMPQGVKEQIYKQVILLKKDVIAKKRLETSKAGCEKFDRVLSRFEKVVIPLVVILLLVFNGVRGYVFRDHVKESFSQYVASRTERLHSATEGWEQDWTGLRSSPKMIKVILSDTMKKLIEVDILKAETREKSKKKMQEEKIEKIDKKIRRVFRNGSKHQ